MRGRLVESRVRGDAHARFGGRVGEGELHVVEQLTEHITDPDRQGSLGERRPA
jgi:hypothetical protein